MRRWRSGAGDDTRIAVTLAGSDSSGGAGIQADLKTFSALGVYGATVITALTAQNTRGVTGIHDVPPAFITAQIDAVFSDLKVGASKIGMLSQPAAIEAVAAGLEKHKAKNIVLDPVMIAASGDRLLRPEAIAVLRRVLIPRASLITPNLPEAAALLDGPEAKTEPEMKEQAQRLLALGAKAVLIKGGHADRRRERGLPGGADERRAARRQPHRHRQYPRHRLHLVVGGCGGSGEGAVRSPKPCARRRLTSPPPSPRQTSSRSGRATARRIIFMRGGEFVSSCPRSSRASRLSCPRSSRASRLGEQCASYRDDRERRQVYAVCAG